MMCLVFVTKFFQSQLKTPPRRNRSNSFLAVCSAMDQPGKAAVIVGFMSEALCCMSRQTHLVQTFH